MSAQQQLLKAPTHALQLKIDDIGLQAWLGSQQIASHNRSESDQSAINGINLGSCMCLLWEKRDPTCLVAACTLAVAGKASKGRLLQARRKLMRRSHEILGNKDDSRRTEGDRAFTNLMKKCVDEVPGNGTAAGPKLFVGAWLR